MTDADAPLPPDVLERLGAPDASAATPADAAARLEREALLHAEGLERVLDQARDSMYDDPATGARLARLVRTAAEQAGIDAAVPPATYLLAQVAVHAGELHEALALLDEARDGFARSGAAGAALRTNLGRTHVLNELGRHEEALAASRAILEGVAADPERPAGADELIAAAEQNSGLCLELMGRFDEALAAYARAEEGHRRTGSARAGAEVAFDRALVLLTLGRHGEALAALHTSADTFHREGFRLRLAETLSQTAEVHLHRGELQRCLAALDEARAALEGIEAPVGDHQRTLVAGRAYLALHLLPEALATFEDAVRFLEATDLVVEQARARWGAGLALAGRGRPAEAAEALDLALQQFRRSGHHGWLAALLVDRARLWLRQGQPEQAEAAAREALSLARAGGVAVSAVHALLLLGELEADREPHTGHGPGPDELFAAARAEAAPLGLAPLTGAVEHAAGRRLLRAGRYAEAEPLLRAAVNAVRDARGGLGQDALLSRYLDDKRSPFEDLLALLVASGGDPAAALDVAEGSKSRALSELVAGLADTDAGDADSDSDAEDEVARSLLADLRATQSELFAPAAIDEARRAILAGRLAELEQRVGLRRLQRSERTVRSGTATPAARAAFGGSGTAANADDAETTEPTEPARPHDPGGDGERIVSYACANGQIHAFVVGPDGPVLVGSIAAVADVEALLQRLTAQLARLSAGGTRLQRHVEQQTRATAAVLAALHARLVAPLRPHLPSGPGPHPLVIVPDGPLHGVPFHALHDGSAPLLERFTVSYAPSIDTYRAVAAARAGAALVAGVADPLAPQVEEEVHAVAERLAAVGPCTVLAGEDATWERVRHGMADAAVVHLAGHAVFRPDNPMYSALRLADRWVTAAELLQLDLRGRTVVLSACGTARNDLATAEVLGFTRALLGAGAATAMTSLWSVDDRSTAAFMARWHEARTELGAAGALRAVQRELAAEGSHPYHWAPWVLFGRR